MKKEAVLSVETAMILPLFVMGLLALASLILMYDFRMKMQAALLYTAQAFAADTSEGHCAALSDIKSKIADYFGDEEDYRYVLNGESGIDLSESYLDNCEYVELSASYRLVSVIDAFGLLSIPVNDRCVVHCWCGYENGYVYDDGVYVYITKNGEVYHTDRECSYINLDIHKTTGKEVGSLRNEDGAKYYKCEYCKPKKKDAILYVTSDGDRYHNSLSCPALKRSVRAVLLRDALNRGMRPCTRCGN